MPFGFLFEIQVGRLGLLNGAQRDEHDESDQNRTDNDNSHMSFSKAKISNRLDEDPVTLGFPQGDPRPALTGKTIPYRLLAGFPLSILDEICSRKVPGICSGDNVRRMLLGL